MQFNIVDLELSERGSPMARQADLILRYWIVRNNDTGIFGIFHLEGIADDRTVGKTV